MARDLKAARKAKGLSQRALSNLVGVPQSHISRIETGGVDLRLSSLVEIARALDLDVTLVPRNKLSAVRSIARSGSSITKEMEAAPSASKELKRLQNTVAKISQKHPTSKEVAQLQRRIKDLGRLKVSASVVDEFTKINESLTLAMAEGDTLGKIGESRNHLQNLRNQIVHAHIRSTDMDKVRPAYSLDEDKHG